MFTTSMFRTKEVFTTREVGLEKEKREGTEETFVNLQKPRKRNILAVDRWGGVESRLWYKERRRRVKEFFPDVHNRYKRVRSRGSAYQIKYW